MLERWQDDPERFHEDPRPLLPGTIQLGNSDGRLINTLETICIISKIFVHVAFAFEVHFLT